MDFDYLIASGDSFTEGCKNVLDITEAHTWPGQLGRSLNVPWANLAWGGASNYDIALQPVQHIHKWCTQNPGEKPLLIFAFTIDYRIPYYSYERGLVKSFYTVLPEEIEHGVHDKNIQNQLKADAIVGTQANGNLLNKMNLEKTNPDDENPKIDGYLYQTYQAINVAKNYENLFKGAKVIWGFIHSTDTGSDVRIKHCPVTNTQYKINWPHWDSCFNRFMPNNEPIQNLTAKKELWISENDCHPNPKGIEIYKDFFTNVIDKI